MQIDQSYIICSSARSGSTLLCRLLAATGVAGRPASYFRRPSVAIWAKKMGLDGGGNPDDPELLQAVLEATKHAGAAETGVFGLRLMSPSRAFLMARLDGLCPGLGSDAARLTAAFGPLRYIHLTRTDRVGQAVSLVRAQQTGLWHRNRDGSELERTAPHAPPVYDAEAIAEAHAEFLAYHDDWLQWFAQDGIVPLAVTYEALAADPVGTLRQVLAWLGRDPEAAAQITPDVAKLADETSRVWAARFEAERLAGVSEG